MEKTMELLNKIIEHERKKCIAFGDPEPTKVCLMATEALMNLNIVKADFSPREELQTVS